MLHVDSIAYSGQLPFKLALQSELLPSPLVKLVLLADVEMQLGPEKPLVLPQTASPPLAGLLEA